MYIYDGYLINEKLRNIDPYSSDTTKEEKKMILTESKSNFSYFINSIVMKNKNDSLLSKIYQKIVEGDAKW